MASSHPPSRRDAASVAPSIAHHRPMLRTPRQQWQRFIISQRATITDRATVDLNVFRFSIILGFAALTFVVSVITVVVERAKAHNKDDRAVTPFWYAIGVSGLLILNNATGAITIKCARQLKRYVYTMFHTVNVIGVLAGVGNIITCLVYAAQRVQHTSRKMYHLYITMDVFNLCVEGIMVAAIVFISYESAFLAGARTCKFVILFIAVVQTLFATVLILHNYAPFPSPGPGSVLPAIRQLVGVCIITESFVAFTISLAVKQKYGLNNVVQRLIRIHSVQVLAFEIFNITIFSLTLAFQSATPQSENLDVILIGISIGTMAINAICVGRLQQVPKSNLRVERLDLFTLSSKQRKELAKRMTQNSRVGEPDGQHAMGLMTGFSSWRGQNISASVVRVYHDTPQKTHSETDALLPLASAPPPNSYDKVQAWQHLDEERWIFGDSNSVEMLPVLEQQPPAPKKPAITKSKQKRLEKKFKAEGMSKDEIAAAIAAEIAKAEAGGADDDDEKGTEPGLPADEFEAMLESTEALVMLTCIDKFDLTTEIPGRFGNFMRKFFGKESCTEWLVVRLGLVATHWPFRPAIFRVSKTKKPVARNAAILRSLIEWNDTLKASERFGFILAPHYKDDSNSRSITPGGWKEIPLPPTHILDLRPYSNLDLKGFLKAIKYRDQAKNFEREGGRIVISEAFSPEEYNEVYDLWKSVASKRSNEGHTSTLAEPDTALLQGLANPVVNESKTWSLMFLKIGDKTIASCVLVRLGDTITSDLQGLDYEDGHKMKAYFVMMQSTIEFALKEKISFVEFGPTTAKPKTDIGCSSIRMTGALYVRNSFLSVMVRMAAKNVDV